ncbi:MAG: N-acetylglucosamine kinase [Flavobacteriaceae bacterium]|jgi:N-acetylglucosamine kinase-like BadF-type ATPase
MILIADGGSTKADWIALDDDKNEVFRVRTLGLNPAVVPKEELMNRIVNMFQLINVKDEIKEIHFYGAGCGTSQPVAILKQVLESIFVNAEIHIAEDLLAAVYASLGKNPGIVCILGTGSNSCYFDGEKMESNVVSLGYTLMDEASGNFFGKRLIRDYFYKTMPENIAKSLEEQYDMDPDHIKFNLYRKPNPNMYLASFAKFMFEFKDDKYIKSLIRAGLQRFFRFRVLPYHPNEITEIYFIGSIAFYFREILEGIAAINGLKIAGVIQRPIDNLIEFHRNNIN